MKQETNMETFGQSEIKKETQKIKKKQHFLFKKKMGKPHFLGVKK